MKKLTALLICVLLVGAMAVPAVAAGVTQMTITSTTASAVPGDEITFEVVISGDTACIAFGLVLKYDSDVFELVDGKCLLSGAMIRLFDQEKGFAYLYNEETIPAGSIGTFTLKVKPDAPTGETEVTGVPSVKNGSESIDSEVVGTSITISGGNSGSSSGSAETAGPKETEKTETEQEKPAGSTTGQPAASTTKQPDTSATEQSAVGATEQTVPEQTAAGMTAVPEETAANEIASSEQPAEEEKPAQERGVSGILILFLALAVALTAVLAVILVVKKNRSR